MKYPKVIGAAAISGSNRNQAVFNKPYHSLLAKAAEDELLIDLVLRACDQALSFANCRPDQIDLIISLSVSLSHFVENTKILGPRITNVVQRELQADNAYVFDLLASDWVFALDLAQTYGMQLGYKRVLLVRGECSAHSIAADADSGFDIADGAAAILLDLSHETTGDVGMRYIEHPHLTSASLLLAPNIFSMSDKKGLLQFPYQASLATDIQNSMLSLYQQSDTVQSVIYERWLPNFALDSTKITCLILPFSNLNDFNQAPFEIALGLQSLLNNQQSNSTKALLLTFDPFKLRVGGLSVYV